MSGWVVTAGMVLAAGRGVRMRPLSDVLPKPALPLPGGPVVTSAARLASATGTRSLVVNTWHLAGRMEKALRTVLPTSVALSLSREQRLMGTAGGLALARERGLLGSEGAVLVVNGDSLLDLPLAPILERFESSRDLVTLALLPHPDPSRWAGVVLDDSGRVTEIRRPDASDRDGGCFLYPGVMVVSRSALDRIPVMPVNTPEALWQPAQRAGRLGGVVVEGSWREVGTPTDYLDAVLDLLGDGSMVDPTAVASDRVRLTTSYVGENVRLGHGSAIVDSVLTGGARVGSGARISRSVLLGPVEVDDGETVTDEIRVAPLRD